MPLREFTTLCTIDLGRICFERCPTSWIIVLELRGDFFALRFDIIAPGELLVKNDENHDVADLERVPADSLPEFDKTLSKAVYLRKIDILSIREYRGGFVAGGYRTLLCI
jgi:hypothetical protein